MPLDTSTPVLILGGVENSLSLTRSLSSYGIPVRVSGGPTTWGLYSRHCTQRFRVPYGQPYSEYWEKLLLLDNEHKLDGHIILECSDEAIEFVACHREELANRYKLCDGDQHQKNAMLDKKKTLEIAEQAGVGAPNFWPIKSAEDLGKIRESLRFPAMVKPIISHKFGRVFGGKLFIVEDDFEELARKIRVACKHNIEVMVVEMIPGPDNLLSSYYTYVDDKGNNLFHYTKRILRRFPITQGGGCYHITEWLPETAELGRKFFDSMNFRGLGNIEFKRDTRDGQLKIIEVNARFTAAQELVVRSGAPLDLIVYTHLTGQAVPTFSTYSQFMRYWYPVSDFRAYLDLRSSGDLSFSRWLKSVVPYRHVFPLWKISDPLPSLMAAGGYVPARIINFIRARRGRG